MRRNRFTMVRTWCGCILLLFACLLLLAAAPISAATISLSFNSLPSAQGWTYVSSGLTETNVFSVDGTKLTQNTLGTGSSGYAYYQMAGILDVTQPFSIEVQARMLGEELSTPGGFSFFATGVGLYAGPLLGANIVAIIDPGPGVFVAVDTSSFHDYLFQANPQNGTWTLYIDGALAASGQLNTSNLPNLVYFGDVSTGVNGRAEINKYIFSQGTVIPEPGTWTMLAAGLMIGFVKARVKR